MNIDPSVAVRPFSEAEFGWEGVPSQPYKEAGDAPFKAISRRVLFAEPALGCELRYFEVAPGGYSTLERHDHVHAVMILRGHGRFLAGDQVRMVKPFDLVSIASWTWHQFRATEGETLGFLCMVNATRDRPQLPSEQELAALRSDPDISAFLE
jgi:quercetin dioxygenase-like cupin family protein